MPARIKHIKVLRGAGGMTLVEVMVAVAILTVALLTLTSVISLGLVQLNSIRIQRGANECARLVMEYLGTMPPDVIYGGAPSPKTGNFATGGGFPSLEDFVNSGTYDACKQLSDPNDPVGKKVQLSYCVCPGCVAMTQTDPSTLMSWTSCLYLLKVKVRYYGHVLGGRRVIYYFTKRQTGASDRCENPPNPNGCGTGAFNGTLRDCTWPNGWD